VIIKSIISQSDKRGYVVLVKPLLQNATKKDKYVKLTQLIKIVQIYSVCGFVGFRL